MNIDLDFSLRKNLSAHVVYILLSQDDIFFTSVKDITIIKIQEGTL